MTEADYITITNLDRVRIASSILRLVHPNDSIPESDLHEILRKLSAWDYSLSETVNDAMGGK